MSGAIALNIFSRRDTYIQRRLLHITRICTERAHGIDHIEWNQCPLAILQLANCTRRKNIKYDSNTFDLQIDISIVYLMMVDIVFVLDSEKLEIFPNKIVSIVFVSK